MRITVLGKSPSWQDAGGACSGYLIEHDDAKVLLDCGNGVFGKLRERIDYVEVDAAVVSHLHADHFLDLVPFSYALTYAPKQQPVPVHTWPGTDRPARPRLVAPPGAGKVFRRVVGAWGNDDLIETAFDLEEYASGSTVEIEGLRVRFSPVPHFIDTFAVTVTADGSGTFAYSADTRPGDEIVEAVRGADLLLIEATLPRPERTGIRGHLTPEEAGEHAKRAGARRVVITHISDELGEDWARDEASRGFGAPVEVAREGAVYEV
ncbi:MAG TPA: MBL fold metallo-hydrolase [Solirubrobacterales bacterium]|nr:MBL fold metallo-hydrolase [Solirubrobacterales bacterium]